MDESNDHLYGRQCTLLAGIGNDQAIDLSQLRIVFNIAAADVECPNVLIARVYNLSDSTVAKLELNQASPEYMRIVLQAGYTGNFGIIFDGQVKQVRQGRENPTDTFVDLLAAEGDELYNFGVVSNSLAKGNTDPKSQFAAIGRSVAPFGVTLNSLPDTGVGGILPRGKVQFGMARAEIRRLMKTVGASWSIRNGAIQVVPFTGYTPGEAVVLTATSGMIGMPIQTNQGIRIRCLLNPKLNVGGLVHIDNKSITTALHDITRSTESLTSTQYDALATLARISDDGFYRIYVIEYRGDTRGQDWYCDLTCLAVDISAPPAVAVKAYG